MPFTPCSLIENCFPCGLLASMAMLIGRRVLNEYLRAGTNAVVSGLKG